MDMKQKKLLKLLITAVCLIALYALCIIMDQTITATSRLYMLITVVRKSAVYALVAVSMNLLNGFTGSARRASCSSAPTPTPSSPSRPRA